MPPVIAIFAIAFILASLLVTPEKKTVPPGKLEDSDDDAGDLIAKALEKYLKEKKPKQPKKP